jgi:hypothetical protein
MHMVKSRQAKLLSMAVFYSEGAFIKADVSVSTGVDLVGSYD